MPHPDKETSYRDKVRPALAKLSPDVRLAVLDRIGVPYVPAGDVLGTRFIKALEDGRTLMTADNVVKTMLELKEIAKTDSAVEALLKHHVTYIRTPLPPALSQPSDPTAEAFVAPQLPAPTLSQDPQAYAHAWRTEHSTLAGMTMTSLHALRDMQCISPVEREGLTSSSQLADLVHGKLLGAGVHIWRQALTALTAAGHSAIVKRLESAIGGEHRCPGLEGDVVFFHSGLDKAGKQTQ